MRIIAILTAATVATVAWSSPVAADRAIDSERTVIMTDVNPCSGELHEVTINYRIRDHAHRNNRVTIFDSAVTTDEGHVGNGTETQVITANGRLRTTINFMNVHPDNGERYSVKGHLEVDLIVGEVISTNFRANCIRPAG